mmetsp:Transcript_24693/g.68721  ORF Transcript_24693/g.68721 Transcript_24693/m.68721 type:complete len:87 (-) Transcript_24693:526-786(-)
MTLLPAFKAPYINSPLSQGSLRAVSVPLSVCLLALYHSFPPFLLATSLLPPRLPIQLPAKPMLEVNSSCLLSIVQFAFLLPPAQLI